MMFSSSSAAKPPPDPSGSSTYMLVDTAFVGLNVCPAVSYHLSTPTVRMIGALCQRRGEMQGCRDDSVNSEYDATLHEYNNYVLMSS